MLVVPHSFLKFESYHVIPPDKKVSLRASVLCERSNPLPTCSHCDTVPARRAASQTEAASSRHLRSTPAGTMWVAPTEGRCAEDILPSLISSTSVTQSLIPNYLIPNSFSRQTRWAEYLPCSI